MTLKNLTGNQIFSPPLFVAGTSGYRLFGWTDPSALLTIRMLDG